MNATADRVDQDPRDDPAWEHRHRDVSGGWLRPTVFGAMDGLVTNVSLIAGVGAGGGSRQTILLTGLAGLVAGAFSMATGEYVSVSSQNELVAAEVRREAHHLLHYPEAERAELADVFARHGLARDLAERVAADISRDQRTALRIHTREELGVDPEELPSAWVAAVASLLAFAAGALVPLLSYLFGATSLLYPLLIGAAVAFVGGCVVGRITSRPVLANGVRQLLLGALAVAVTYAVGRLIGVSV